MAIVQNIEYNSDNQYISGFLQNFIDESNLNASVTQTKDKIVLTIDEKDTENLKKFSELTTHYLPHSIFMGEIKTNLDENVKVKKTKFRSKRYNISLCTRCLEDISNPASQNYLDDSLVCNHYTSEVQNNYINNDIFTPNYSDGSTLLLVNPSKIGELFIITKEEYKALFSIEKPTIKVTIQDENLQQLTGKKFINIRAPYDIKSTLASLNAKDSELDYIFFTSTTDSKVVVIKENISIINDTSFSKQLEPLHTDKVVNRFLNITNEAKMNRSAIGANLSMKNGISFLASTQTGAQKVINFQKFSLNDTLSKMDNDQTRKKLLDNYKLKFPNIIENIDINSNEDVFSFICKVLELDNYNFEALNDKALEFHGNGGLKIDMNFTIDGFDYESFLGSIISFKLAGVDNHYLAYSIFEAYGDMTISILNQLKTKLKIDNFVMMGDMFENSILYSRILSKFQLSNPYFSKSIAFDG